MESILQQVWPSNIEEVPESHVILVFSARQGCKDVLLDGLVVLVAAQQDVSSVQGLIAGLEPPEVHELILVADKHVEVAGRPAAELQTGGHVVVEELAEPLVRLEVAFDGPALDVVHLKLYDLLPRSQSLRMGSVLDLDCPRLEEAPEETGFLS